MNSTSPTGPSTEPVIGTLRVTGGQRVRDATPCAVALSSPLQAVRSRQDEHLFILSDLTGPVSSRLYRELREVVAQTYWSTAGSITAALRQAAAAANRHLFLTNLHSTPAGRYHGGLICAILRGKDLFILQAGSARACFLHEGDFRCFSYDGDLAPLGVARVADVRLHHTYVASGDQLLMVSSALVEATDYTGLARVMALAGVQEVLEGLEQVGVGVDFSAMFVRWSLPGEDSAIREASLPHLSTDFTPSERIQVEPQAVGPVERRESIPQRWRQESRVERAAPRPERAGVPVGPTEFPDPGLGATSFSSVEALGQSVRSSRTSSPQLPQADEQAPVIGELARPEPAREPGPSLGEWIEGIARSIGRGGAAAGGALIGGTSTLVKRMLPGKGTRRRARASSSRAPRPVPEENRTTMVAVAIGIPLVLAITVTLAYQLFGEDARFNTLIKQVEENVSLAQSTGVTSDTSRSYWHAALEYADAAIVLRPDDPIATSLRAQAQAALDQLDGIVRLQPILLKDFGPGTLPRRLVVHGPMIFVLDPAGGWVAQLTLNEAGNGLSEQDEIPGLVRKEQQIEGGTVGNLVDFVWVEPMGGRQTSGLVILEEDGALISHDPAWQVEGGRPQLGRAFLGAPPELPRVVGTYDGRLYVLDTSDNQIRRYEPVGDIYPNRPDNYFVVPPSKPLANALDMAIDGYIYILYADGAILKFLRGEPDQFDVRGLPGDLNQAVALAVDPGGNSGVVYVADRGNRRVVALAPDGTFLAQFRADTAFDALEGLAVDEAMGRLYVISNGQLSVASLP
jgi:hypothetical protein